jgi:hypothetical protein
MSNSREILGRIGKGALRGELDPGRIFGPRSFEIRDNKAERQRRADQIFFEKNNLLLKKMGGSTDDPTFQIKRLKGSPALRALSPLSAPGGLARTLTAITEGGPKTKKFGKKDPVPTQVLRSVLGDKRG